VVQRFNMVNKAMSRFYPASKWALRSLLTIRSGIPRFVGDVRRGFQELAELLKALFEKTEVQVQMSSEVVSSTIK